MNLPAFKARRQAMLDGIFDHRLQQHGGDEGGESFFLDFLEDLQFVAAEADHFDVEIIVNEFQLFAQRHERFVFAQQSPQNVRKLQHDAARHIGIEANQRRNRVECVEQEMRVDLAGERVHARAEQELLILLEVHFDARVVPNFYGDGHAHHRRKNFERNERPVVRRNREQPGMRRNGAREFNLTEFKSGADQQRQHRPIAFAKADQFYEPLRNIQKKERAEMPDVFLFRNHFADHAGEQSDQRGKRARQPLVMAECGKRDERAAEQSNDAPANQAHQKGSFEHQIKEAVAEQAQHDADRERRRQKQQQHHFLIGVPDFREDKLSKRAEADQQRSKRRRKAHFQDQREKQIAANVEVAHFVCGSGAKIPRATLAKGAGDVKNVKRL